MRCHLNREQPPSRRDSLACFAMVPFNLARPVRRTMVKSGHVLGVCGALYFDQDPQTRHTDIELQSDPTDRDGPRGVHILFRFRLETRDLLEPPVLGLPGLAASLLAADPLWTQCSIPGVRLGASSAENTLRRPRAEDTPTHD